MLARNNVSYTSIDISANSRAHDFMLQMFGAIPVPVTVIDDSFVQAGRVS